MKKLSVYIYSLGLDENIPTTWYFKILNQQSFLRCPVEPRF